VLVVTVSLATVAVETVEVLAVVAEEISVLAVIVVDGVIVDAVESTVVGLSVTVETLVEVSTWSGFPTTNVNWVV
jgi:hypothetical protein